MILLLILSGEYFVCLFLFEFWLGLLFLLFLFIIIFASFFFGNLLVLLCVELFELFLLPVKFWVLLEKGNPGNELIFCSDCILSYIFGEVPLYSSFSSRLSSVKLFKKVLFWESSGFLENKSWSSLSPWEKILFSKDLSKFFSLNFKISALILLDHRPFYILFN